MEKITNNLIFRWNGPPPRCDPLFCEEPASIRNGGFSLSTNSMVVGTVASYYCTTPRHVLVGVPKLTCLKEGTWDAPFPGKCLKASDFINIWQLFLVT